MSLGASPAMDAEYHAKLRAAHSAAALVEPGMLVGLGSGTTATEVVRKLGERKRVEGLNFVGIPTSAATAELARNCGLLVREFDEVGTLDLCLDGADEVDPRFRMIKGRGGALLREKIVAYEAQRRVNIITAEKRVESLGAKMPVPVEVSIFGLKHTERRLRALGAETTPRIGETGARFLTDGGNSIIDCRFPTIADPATLEQDLLGIVGVFETGLFLELCDLLIVGSADSVEILESHVRG